MPDRAPTPDNVAAVVDEIRRFNQSLITRRSLFRGVGMAGAVVIGSNLLAACGSEGTANQGTTEAVEDLSATEKVVNWSNWPLYIDTNEEEDTHPTLQQFEEQTGITVNYTEEINDNQEFFAKIRPQLEAGEPTGRDLIVLTDWMAARLIRLGYVEKLNRDNIPNGDNLAENLRAPGFDADRSYTLPWQSGLTGIAYNPKATNGKEITSMEQLLTDPELKGRVTALTEMRDTMGLILLAQGADPANFTDEEYEKAIEWLQQAVNDGQIRQFTGNDYAQGLAAGNIAACVAWSGDVIQLQYDNPDIVFVVPEAGGMIWSDNMMIPRGASHKTNAEKLMNYYYDPQVAAEVAAWVNYICPVEGAKEAMMDIDPELADNPLIFPDEATEAKTHIFEDLPPDTETKYVDMFTAVTGA